MCESNQSCMICVPNVHTCGQNWKHALYHLHTVHHETKFIGFLCKHKKNCAHRVDRFFHVCKLLTSCLSFWLFFSFFFYIYGLVNVHWVCTETMVCHMLSHIRGKLIYWAPRANCMQTMQLDQGVHACIGLKGDRMQLCHLLVTGNKTLSPLCHICQWVVIERLTSPLSHPIDLCPLWQTPKNWMSRVKKLKERIFLERFVWHDPVVLLYLNYFCSHQSEKRIPRWNVYHQ